MFQKQLENMSEVLFTRYSNKWSLTLNLAINVQAWIY